MRVTDPSPRSTNPGIRAWWGIGALLALVFIVAAAIALWNYQSHTSPTAGGPSTTQSTPSSTGRAARQIPGQHDSAKEVAISVSTAAIDTEPKQDPGQRERKSRPLASDPHLFHSRTAEIG
jgi:hypothetical protein